MINRVILFSFLVCTFFSCGGEQEKKPKSPTVYGVEYCDCVIKNDMDDSKCVYIIEKNKEAYGKDNKEAEAEFKAAAISCIGKKSGNN